MKTRFLFASLSILFLSIAGCDSNDPSLNKLKVEMVAQTSSASGSFSGGRISTQADTVIFDSFLLGVTEITLKSKGEHGDGKCMNDNDDEENHEGDEDSDNEDDDQDGNNKWKVEGEYVVDLIEGTSTPDITADLPAEPGTYHKMEIELSPILEDGNSLFVEASVVIGEDTLKVEYATKRKFEIHLKNKNGIEISPSLDKVLVAFSVDKLFAGVDWSKAKIGEDGIIHIQDPGNAVIAYKIKYNFYAMMKWGHDKNHDHRLDDHDDD